MSMKQVDGNFLVNFTTENADKLPTAFKMNNDLEHLFAAVLDKYLESKGVEVNEVHFILCDDLTIEDYDD